jgi:hypothetical protein
VDRNCGVGIWSVDSDQHDDCLEYLYRLPCNCLFGFVYLCLLLDLCYMCGNKWDGRGILPIRLVYSPEGRGVGNLSWPLSG